MLRIFLRWVFFKTDFNITAYQGKQKGWYKPAPDMRLKHRLFWNKLLSSRAYSMDANIDIFYEHKICIIEI